MKHFKAMVFVISLLAMSVALWALSKSDARPRQEDSHYTLTGKEDHSITLEEAAQYMLNFRRTAKPDTRIGGYFGSEAILRILQQKDCVGLRYYYGTDETGQNLLILMGVDANGKDMINGELAERSWFCPPFCRGGGDDDSFLNQLTNISQVSGAHPEKMQ